MIRTTDKPRLMSSVDISGKSLIEAVLTVTQVRHLCRKKSRQRTQSRFAECFQF